VRWRVGWSQYGTTASYGSETPLNTDLTLVHSVTLANLTPNTLYHYRVRSSDEVGNVAVSSDNTFTTNALGVITQSFGFSGVETEAVGTREVTINWQTTLPADSQIEYGESSLLGHTTPLSLRTYHPRTR